MNQTRIQTLVATLALIVSLVSLMFSFVVSREKLNEYFSLMFISFGETLNNTNPFVLIVFGVFLGILFFYVWSMKRNH